MTNTDQREQALAARAWFAGAMNDEDTWFGEPAGD